MAHLVLRISLAAFMVGHLSTRRPKIALDELFQEDTTAADHVQDRRAEYHPKGVPCYFNRDCESQQFCVKPDRNVFTSGTCSFVPNFEPARPNERTRDLHFVVHNPRMAREVFLKANLQGQVQPSSAGGTEPRIRTPAGLSKTYKDGSKVPPNKADLLEIVPLAEGLRKPHHLPGSIPEDISEVVGQQRQNCCDKPTTTSLPCTHTIACRNLRQGNYHEEESPNRPNKSYDEVVVVTDNDMASGPLRASMVSSQQNTIVS